jgi:O-antigen ligase
MACARRISAEPRGQRARREPTYDKDVSRTVVTAASGSLRRSPARGAPLALLAVAALVGLVAGFNPAIGFGLAVAVVFAFLVMWDLALGVCGFLLLAALDVISQNQDLSLTKAAGALLVVAWLAAAATQGASRRDLLAGQPWLTTCLVAFLGWCVLSMTWAESPDATVRASIRFGLNAMLIPIIYLAVRERKHVVWVLAIFVLGAMLSVLWGVTHPATTGPAAEQTGRLTGARGEANATATLLVVSIVFSGALAVVLRGRTVARALAIAAALAGMVALFATFSRAGLLALAVVILVGVIYGGRWRAALGALALAAVVIGVVFLNETGSSASDRLTESSTSGRGSIWTVGWRMVEAHPIVGVGGGNYTTVAPHFLLTSPGTIEDDQYILDKPLVAHNIYLHVLAEMGIVGLALFLAVLALSIGSAMRAVRIFHRRRERSMEVLGRALVVAVIANLVAGFFLSGQYSKQLWVLLALGPAMLAIALREPAPEPASDLLPPRRAH